MTFDKTKPMPDWITRKHTNPNTIRGQKYYKKLWQAQPVWANRKAINSIYAAARKLRRQGINVHVDHIYPLCGETMCGLHIASNLMIVPAGENIRKSNCEHEQLDFFKPAFFELEYDIKNSV